MAARRQHKQDKTTRLGSSYVEGDAGGGGALLLQLLHSTVGCCAAIRGARPLRETGDSENPRQPTFQVRRSEKLPPRGKQLESGGQGEMEVKVSITGLQKLGSANMQTRVLEDFYKLRQTLTSAAAAAGLMRSS